MVHFNKEILKFVEKGALQGRSKNKKEKEVN